MVVACLGDDAWVMILFHDGIDGGSVRTGHIVWIGMIMYSSNLQHGYV